MFNYTPRSSRVGKPCPEVPKEAAVTRNSVPTLELREVYFPKKVFVCFGLAAVACTVITFSQKPQPNAFEKAEAQLSALSPKQQFRLAVGEITMPQVSQPLIICGPDQSQHNAVPVEYLKDDPAGTIQRLRSGDCRATPNLRTLVAQN